MHYNELIKKIDKNLINNLNYLIKYYFKKDILTKEEINKLEELLELSKTYPLQYIVGSVNFYGYEYKVTEDVLIPRFETEELVENTIKYIKEKKYKKVLDLCTGSGCIGITLKKEIPSLDVTLSDISKKALQVASYNSKDIDINIIESDILTNINDKYDVIISNPPYISYNEEIMDIVKNNEPAIALYAKDDGLYFYEEILKNCKKNLNKDFLIAFEIGYQQKNKIIEIVNKYFDDVNIICKKDIEKKDRMLFIMNKQ